MEFAFLGSGSKGNCFVLKSKSSLIVIDCGGSKKSIVDGFKSLDLNIENVDACLITHLHQDHISQLGLFDEIPIYSSCDIKGYNINIVDSLSSFIINDVEIMPIELSHDCDRTMGFILSHNSEKLVYITDTGYLNDKYIPYLYGATYIILESNHDVEMLMNSNRPQFLKSRIYCDSGHLSNDDCAQVLSKIVTVNTKEIILAHLSRDCNSDELALLTSINKLKNNKELLSSNIIIKVAKQDMIIKGGVTHEENLMDSSDSFINLV
ncbi:MAG: MBL fold metallo-hydrolase [Anaerorhabdus sp.]